MPALAQLPVPVPVPDAAIGDTLAAAVRELDHIAMLGQRLQDRLSPLLKRAGEAALEAQALDELVQQAQGLALFLDRVAEDCPPGWRISPHRAAADLGLAAQRRRLSTGEPFAPPSPPDLESDGGFELF